MNNAPFPIEYQEIDRPADHWLNVQPKSCRALWPKSEKEDKLLKLRVEGTTDTSASFLYSESHTTLLRLNNKVNYKFSSIISVQMLFVLVRWY